MKDFTMFMKSFDGIGNFGECCLVDGISLN